MEIKVYKVRENAKMPFKKHLGDAGYDLSWCPKDASEYQNMWHCGKEYKEAKLIMPNESVLLATGLKFIFPSDHVMEVKNRSGIASKKGLVVGACIVDSTYRGEVFVNLHNISGQSQVIEVGERIAQFVVYKVENCLFDEVTEEVYNSNESSRNDGGFGSTGNK